MRRRSPDPLFYKKKMSHLTVLLLLLYTYSSSSYSCSASKQKHNFERWVPIKEGVALSLPRSVCVVLGQLFRQDWRNDWLTDRPAEGDEIQMAHALWFLSRLLDKHSIDHSATAAGGKQWAQFKNLLHSNGVRKRSICRPLPLAFNFIFNKCHCMAFFAAFMEHFVLKRNRIPALFNGPLERDEEREETDEEEWTEGSNPS